jgi:hypothetical protein
MFVSVYACVCKDIYTRFSGVGLKKGFQGKNPKIITVQNLKVITTQRKRFWNLENQQFQRPCL